MGSVGGGFLVSQCVLLDAREGMIRTQDTRWKKKHAPVAFFLRARSFSASFSRVMRCFRWASSCCLFVCVVAIV